MHSARLQEEEIKKWMTKAYFSDTFMNNFSEIETEMTFS